MICEIQKIMIHVMAKVENTDGSILAISRPTTLKRIITIRKLRKFLLNSKSIENSNNIKNYIYTSESPETIILQILSFNLSFEQMVFSTELNKESYPELIILASKLYNAPTFFVYDKGTKGFFYRQISLK